MKYNTEMRWYENNKKGRIAKKKDQLESQYSGFSTGCKRRNELGRKMKRPEIKEGGEGVEKECRDERRVKEKQSAGGEEVKG